MKLALFSHCVIDTIVIDGVYSEQVGGPACYGSLTAKNFKFDIDLFTKFGPDFTFKNNLIENKINLKNSVSEKPTTRFEIQINGSERSLFLKNMCEPIEYTKSDADGVLISPIFNEISPNTLEKIKKDCNFIFIDPQGFLRRVDTSKRIYLEKTDINLAKVSAIKVGVDEATNIVGDSNVEALKNLQKKGVEFVIRTNKQDIDMLVKEKLYSLRLPNREIYDTTGIGDIFCSTFCSTMLKENDVLWAFCFACGSAQAALDSKEIGLNKIPKRGTVETNAAYFYNTVKFKQV